MPISYKNNLTSLDISILDPDGGTISGVPHYNIIEYNMIWDTYLNGNKGNLSFYDYENVFSIVPISSEHKIKVVIVDSLGVENVEYYNISRIESSMFQQQVYIVKLHLIDEYNFNLSRIYLSKGYKDSTFTDIVKQYIDIAEKHIIGKKKVISNENNQFDTIVVPMNTDFLSWVSKSATTYGFKFFISKESIYIANIHNFYDNFTDRSSIKFKFDHYQSQSPNKIFDLNIGLVDNLLSVKESPSSKIFTFNPLDKNIKANNKIQTYLGMNKAICSTGGVINPNNTIGYKGIVKSLGANEEDNKYFDHLSKNYIVEFTIMGLKELDIGELVSLDLAVPGSVLKNQLVNGKWGITRISEKIQGLCYTQKISLSSPTLGVK